MKLSDLTPAPYNPRKISDKKLAMLQKAMAEFGDLSGIIFNRRTGRLIGGHQRLKVFSPDWPISKEPHEDVLGTVALGFIESPWGRWVYREVDWDDTKEKAANVATNKHGGEWDFPLLSELMVELDTGEFDMELTGFNEKELQKLLAPIQMNDIGFSETTQEKVSISITFFECDKEAIVAEIKTMKEKYDGFAYHL